MIRLYFIIFRIVILLNIKLTSLIINIQLIGCFFETQLLQMDKLYIILIHKVILYLSKDKLK